jgi:hypothetical protein
MPNTNYIRGRRWEYEIKQRWGDGKPFRAVRTAGSHGEYDIVVYKTRWDEGPEGSEVYKPGSTREIRRGYEYITYVTPITGYGIQCKVKKIKGLSKKRG